MKRATIILTALLILSGCGKPQQEPLKVSQPEFNLKNGQTANIISNAVSPVYKSENDYHATVDDNGQITAGYVGETSISIKAQNGSASVKVTVEPKSNLYEEPCLVWGTTRQQIINKYGDPGYSSGNVIGYYSIIPNDDYLGTLYSFGANGLETATVMFKSNRAKDVVSFLEERYRKVGLQGEFIIFENCLAGKTPTVIAGAYYYNPSTYAVLYSKTNPS